jgi:5'-nucleotidase/UDP-sugar diphosphatase
MKRILLLFLIAVVSGCSTDSVRRESDRYIPLTILHWNDFHARNMPYTMTVRDTMSGIDTTYQVGGAATLHGYVNSIRREHPRVLVLNAGDDFQGTPISSLTLGRSQIDLMNLVRPDAMALGNHEFDYGADPLRENLVHAQFPVLSANVWDQASNRLFSSDATVVDVNGVRVGLIGFVPPELPSLVVRDRMEGLVMLDVDSLLTRNIRRFRSDGVDLIVVVSHMGFEHDQRIARNHPDIDIVVGGHDHRPLHQPVKENRTIIVQAGSWGRYVGKLDLVVDVAGDSVFSWQGKLVEMRAADIVPDTRTAAKVDELESGIRDKMREVIGELRTAWTRPPRGQRTESSSGNWQADMMREYAEVDVAFQNVGGIRKDLAAGPITVGDVWEMNPFGNHFVVFHVDGATLRRMIDFQTTVSLREFVQVSGVRYSFDSSKPPGERLSSIEVGGAPLDEKARYTVVTNNYVASSLEDHFGIHPDTITVTELADLDRDVFIERIRREKIITPVLDGRIKDVGPTTK